MPGQLSEGSLLKCTLSHSTGRWHRGGLALDFIGVQSQRYTVPRLNTRDRAGFIPKPFLAVHGPVGQGRGEETRGQSFGPLYGALKSKTEVCFSDIGTASARRGPARSRCALLGQRSVLTNNRPVPPQALPQFVIAPLPGASAAALPSARYKRLA
jgi:hypothetical protein